MYGSYRKWMVGITAGSILIMTLLVLIPYLMLKPWQSIWKGDVWYPVLGVALVVSAILAVIGAFGVKFKNKDTSLRRSTGGDVLIALDGVTVNGSLFAWGNAKSGWRLERVDRKTVLTEAGKSIEILEFNCSTDIVGVRTKTHIDKMERIPIPAGKETEAARVIDRLRDEKHRSHARS